MDFKKFKNIKFNTNIPTLNFQKLGKRFLDFKKKNKDLAQTGEHKKKSDFIKNLKEQFLGKISKSSLAGEEIIGLDISRDAIRVAQVSKNKNDDWVLEKYSTRSLDPIKLGEDIVENKDYLAEEIGNAILNAKITAKNVAISIPVTSAIIRVVTSPLMSEEEVNSAIETDSLWENLVQLTENLNDYSIFHQVINRDTKSNTMDILFVASKLSDVNAYSNIAKKAGLNPVIMDVRCFTLKNALDNIYESPTVKQKSAILELGLDENYFIIVHNNIPIITDIFLRPNEKKAFYEIDENKNTEESKNVIRRYGMQIKQAITEYERKYNAQISDVRVVSGLDNIEPILALLKKVLMTTNFKLFDPIKSVVIPEYNKDKIAFTNKSTMTTALGLAFRKLDVFGYYKFVTAVKNINLLPNRDTVRQQSKMKFLSGFALKGAGISIAAIYLLLIGSSIFQIQSNKSKLERFDSVEQEFNKINKDFLKLSKERKEMAASLNLGKKIKSNQAISFLTLAQISQSVPPGVSFSKIQFNGEEDIVIQGNAPSDQDILVLIGNLNKQSYIQQASLASMSVAEQNSQKKGFIVNCKIKKRQS
jgi:type IV pilus assembly protein PilN